MRSLEKVIIGSMVIVSIVLVSGCSDISVGARYENEFWIPEINENITIIGDSPIPTYESTCKAWCAATCANFNMKYAYSRIDETAINDIGKKCICGCN